MTMTEFVTAFAEKSIGYDAFEYGELVRAVKGCDEKLKSTFFPNAEALSGLAGCSELAIKLVCYTIAKTTAYGFNKCINAIPYPSTIGSLLSGNAVLGEWVLRRFIDGMIDSSDLTDDFKASIFAAVTAGHYVSGTFAEMCAGHRVKASLLFKFVKIYMPARYNEFYTIYHAENQSLTETLDQIPYFESYATDDKLYLGIQDDVAASINAQTNIKDYTTQKSSRYVDSVGVHTCSSTYKHHEYDVGQAVLKWLDSDDLKKYGLRSKETVDNHVHTCELQKDDGAGCVTAQTLIAMADGGSKPITSLCPGMKVRSAGGISILSDEFVVNRGLKTLYGINELEPFMSLEHAVMTTDGWKSLAPEQSNQINSYYNVTLLRQGDWVLTLDGTVQVNKITVAQASPGKSFTGYDLHFASGEKSYYANGLLVLLNYPDITLARLMRALDGMEACRRRHFFALFQAEQSLFEELFPGGLATYFKECAYEKFKNDFGKQS